MIIRRALVAAATVALLVACDGAARGQGLRSAVETDADRAQGNPDAPIVMIEYASVMCPACEYFHLEILPEIRERYIDTGEVRHVFREFPTAPAPLAMAGFLLARCAAEEDYFDVIDVLFRQRGNILESARAGQQRDVYLRISRQAGIEDEALFACLGNEEEILRINEGAEFAVERYGVGVTPSFIINGRLYEGAQSVEQFDAIFAEALGRPIPESEPGEDAVPEPAASAADDHTGHGHEEGGEGASDAPADEPAAEDAPAEDASAEGEAPVEDAPAEAAATDEAPAEDAPADGAPEER